MRINDPINAVTVRSRPTGPMAYQAFRLLKLVGCGLAAVILFSSQLLAQLPDNNIWPNGSFEEGTDLDSSTPLLNDWSASGSNVAIDILISDASSDGTYALGVLDENGQGFGEWYSDLDLAGLATGGDTLTLQWFEIFNITGGEMRLTSLFFDATDQVVGERHFTASGDSQGWQASLANSTFSQRIESLIVPGDAIKWRLALVSGGSEATTGLFVIDDLSVARAPTPQVLANNFWVNPGFEEGTALDETSGTLSGWNRGGSDVGINRIANETSVSPSHALAVIDESTTDFGEWYSDKALEGFAKSGDVLNVQWFELFNVSEDGAMRLSILFFGSDDTLLGENHFEASAQSAGWSGELATSTFSLKNAQVIVPSNASKMRISLVSGGPLETTGVMTIDDLSVARMPQGEISPGNFWPNPTFELGSQLDNPAAANPAGWNRGGSNASINVVTNENSVSPNHALAVIDNDDSGYGEWYQSVPLAESISAGDELLVKWFEMYGTDGEMRLSFLFFDAGDAVVGENQFIISGESEDWKGDIASSQFTSRQESLFVPEGATRLQVGLVSGGSEAVTGIYVIDDLSISPPAVEPAGGPLEVTAFAHDQAADTLTITWSSSIAKTYAIETSTDLVIWDVTVKSNIAATGTETSYSFQDPGLPITFFRVLEE